MLQFVQYFSNGFPEIVDIPYPSTLKYKLIIKTTICLISCVNEKISFEFGKSNLVKKTIDQPDKVKKAINKNDRILSTYNFIKNKLDESSPIDYLYVSVVQFVGKKVKAFMESVNNHIESPIPVEEIIKVQDNVFDVLKKVWKIALF